MHYQTALIQLPLVCQPSGALMRTPEDVSRICDDIRNLAQETFHVFLLNRRNEMVNRHMVSLGICDATLVQPLEIFRPALIENCNIIVLAHNHPSGDPSPSAEDIRITKTLVDAGRILKITVYDHVIIGRATDTRKGFYSLREHGLCDFSA